MKIDDNWFSQQNEFDNAAAVVHNLMHVLNIKITRETIYNGLNDEPGYPSLKSIENFLRKWQFETLIAKVNSDVLHKIECPVIAWMDNNYYVLLMECSKKEIKYINPKKGWIIESPDFFIQKWSGVIIDIVPGGISSEENYKEKIELERKKNDEKLGRLKVEVIDDFLTSEECDYLIELSHSKFERSLTLKHEGGGSHIDEGRSSFTAHLDVKDKLVEKIYDKGAKILNIPRENFEYLQCTSYNKNQEYREHHDAFKKSEKEDLKFGQRVSTILIYLNDNFTGGQTYFPMIDVRVKPKKGSAAIWHHLLENGERDSDLFHAGLPVVEGKKYVANLWPRDKDFGRFGNS